MSQNGTVLFLQPCLPTAEYYSSALPYKLTLSRVFLRLSLFYSRISKFASTRISCKYFRTTRTCFFNKYEPCRRVLHYRQTQTDLNLVPLVNRMKANAGFPASKSYLAQFFCDHPRWQNQGFEEVIGNQAVSVIFLAQGLNPG